jgi:hypothetical protein
MFTCGHLSCYLSLHLSHCIIINLTSPKSAIGRRCNVCGDHRQFSVDLNQRGGVATYVLPLQLSVVIFFLFLSTALSPLIGYRTIPFCFAGKPSTTDSPSVNWFGLIAFDFQTINPYSHPKKGNSVHGFVSVNGYLFQFENVFTS